MINVPTWLAFVFMMLFVAAVTVATISTRLLYHNPAGLPDLGHRCFRVADTNTRLAVAEVLRDVSGIKEAMTFEPEPTIQTLLDDGRTVLIEVDDLDLPPGAGPNFLSLPVEAEPKESAPMEAAIRTQTILAARGIAATIHPRPLPQLGDKTVLLTCEKFNGWSLLFRLHSKELGSPPKVRRDTGRDGLIVNLMRRLPESE